jgi:hypothetical protein
MKKVAVAAAAAGCLMQTVDAFAVVPGTLARATPGLRPVSSARPHRGLCAVKMGTSQKGI